jgi:hypothetical protein
VTRYAWSRVHKPCAISSPKPNKQRQLEPRTRRGSGKRDSERRAAAPPRSRAQELLRLRIQGTGKRNLPMAKVQRHGKILQKRASDP